MPGANSMLDIVFRNRTNKRAFGPLFFKKVLSVAALKSGLGKGCVEISLTLLGPAQMRVMNKRYRGVDAPTDVLSFPLNSHHKPRLAGSGMKRYNEIALGDIFICPSFALKNARRNGFSPREALAWCAVHGFLHLAGYNHERSSRARRSMDVLEKKVLTALAYGSTSHHLRN